MLKKAPSDSQLLEQLLACRNGTEKLSVYESLQLRTALGACLRSMFRGYVPGRDPGLIEPVFAEALLELAREYLGVCQQAYLRRREETRRAFHVSELTDAEAEQLVRDLQDSIDND